MTTDPLPAGPAGPRGPAGRRPAGPPRPPEETGPAAPVGLAGRGPAGSRRPVEEAALLALARRFAALYLEVEAGRREGRQLAGLVTPRLALRLSRPAVTRRGAGRIHSVGGFRSRADRFDAVAVVGRGPRYGALSIRLVRVRDRWLVDQAGRPEDRGDTVHLDRRPMAGRPRTR